MTETIIIAAICIAIAVALFKGAFYFTLDAGPVGSIMIVLSAAFFVGGIFTTGMVVGMMVSS